MSQKLLIPNRLGWLDELRGLAAIMVMLGHFSLFFPSMPFMKPLYDIFPRGVQLFYLLSGYILFRLYSDHISTWKDYKAFLTKRFFRIAPTFYVLSIICAIVFRPSDLFANLGLHFLILPFGFFHKYLDGIIGIEWSVFVECWFYVAFPVLIYLFRQRLIIAVLLCFLISGGQTVLFYALGLDVGARTFWYKMPQTQLIFFITGFLISACHTNFSHRIKQNMTLVCIGFMGIGIIPYFIRPFTLQFYLCWPFLAAIVFCYPAIKKWNWISKSLEWAGKRSYSIYLIHMPLLNLMKDSQAITSNWLSCLGLLTLALFLSSLSWHLIEKPGIDFGRYLLARGLKNTIREHQKISEISSAA